MIHFDNVSKLYPSQSRPALENVNIDVEKGEFIFLVGPSGSGKSTFLRLVLKEERPTEGRIHVAGKDLARLTPWRIPLLRRRIGCVFQDFRLLPNKNIYQNVAFALEVIGKPRRFIRKVVPEVIDLVGLEGKHDRMPDELSGGEQQRVAMARAFVNRPMILLADEPTGNIDPATSIGIMKVLDRINRTGTTVVVVAISLSLLGTGLLFVKQVNNTRTYWQGKVEISVYLCTATSVSTQCRQNGPVTPAELASIKHDLQSLPQVQHVYYESQAQAYQHFKQDFSQDPSFVSTVTQGDIPSSFQVKLKSPTSDFNVVAGTVQGRPGVDDIVDDRSILNNFYKLLDGARNAVVIIAIILIVAAALLVANTIRLSAFNRRRETSIMRLVGASNFYIQLPFLVEGVIAGLVGWLIAAGLLVAVKSLGLDTLQEYFTFNVRLSSTDLIEVVLLTMVVGVLLCGATSFLTLRRYLRV